MNNLIEYLKDFRDDFYWSAGYEFLERQDRDECLPYNPIGIFISWSLGVIKCEIMHKIICPRFGHKWIDHGYTHRDHGVIDMECSRCHDVVHHHLY